MILIFLVAPPKETTTASEGDQKVESPPSGGDQKVESPPSEGAQKVESPPSEGAQKVESPPREGAQKVESPPSEGAQKVESPPREVEVKQKPQTGMKFLPRSKVFHIFLYSFVTMDVIFSRKLFYPFVYIRKGTVCAYLYT